MVEIRWGPLARARIIFTGALLLHSLQSNVRREAWNVTELHNERRIKISLRETLPHRQIQDKLLASPHLLSAACCIYIPSSSFSPCSHLPYHLPLTDPSHCALLGGVQNNLSQAAALEKNPHLTGPGIIFMLTPGCLPSKAGSTHHVFSFKWVYTWMGVL